MSVQRDAAEAEVAPAVRRLVYELLPPRQRPADDDDLFAHGLTSLQSVEVVLELEDAFGVSIPEDLITPEALRTIRGIAATVVSCLP